MKKVLICVTLLLCLGFTLTAQAYIYNPANTPGSGGTNSWPFRSYTAWRFQFIIDASVMTNAPIKILDIAFSPQYNSIFTSSNFQMRMGHTTHKNFSGSGTTKFDDMLGPCPTIVYNGPFTWSGTAATWCDLGLQAAFGYDGVRNICVELRYNGGSANQRVYTDASIARAYTHTSYSADPFNEPNWYVPISGEMMGPIHRLTVDRTCILLAPDTVPIGSTAAIQFVQGPAGAFYLIAASFGQTALPLGPCTIYLTPDTLFLASILVGPPIFNYYTGVLPASGTSAGKLLVPKANALIGLCIYHAGVAYDKGGIKCCTNTDGTQITP